MKCLANILEHGKVWKKGDEYKGENADALKKRGMLGGETFKKKEELEEKPKKSKKYESDD